MNIWPLSVPCLCFEGAKVLDVFLIGIHHLHLMYVSVKFWIFFPLDIHFVTSITHHLVNVSVSVKCVVGLVGVSGLGLPRETQRATSEPKISILPSEQSRQMGKHQFCFSVCEKSSEGKYLMM